ncbi:MAG: hypothetical protein FWD31_13140, partial [Planctomycetaceae bacterium]|nr:hypothetical protein [Planctomycetaceae bacterium]
DFIRQGGDELFLIAVRAEAYQRDMQYLKAIDDYLVVLEFGTTENANDTEDIVDYPGFAPWFSKKHACYQLANCYFILSLRNPKNQEYFEKAIEYCTLLIELYPEYRGLPVAYSWRVSLYTTQLSRSDLTEEQRELYTQLRDDNARKILEIQEKHNN